MVGRIGSTEGAQGAARRHFGVGVSAKSWSLRVALIRRLAEIDAALSALLLKSHLKDKETN
eukprot:5729286-Pleurochrysis_carterae.AAC.1